MYCSGNKTNNSEIMKNLNIILLFITSFASAQTTTFFNTYSGGYEGRCVEQTTDNGFVIIGKASNLVDIYMVKTNNTGDTLWTKKYGGAYYDIGYSIQQTFDNGFVIAGKYGEPDTMMEGNGNVYVIKTDELGDTLWTCIMGDEGWGDYAYSVQQTSDTGYIVGGVFHASINGGEPIAFLSKLNSNGTLIWTKTYPDFRCAFSVIQTFDGGFVFTGYDGIVRTNDIGDTLWTKKDNWGFNFGKGYSIIQTTDSNFVMTGYSYYAGNSNLFLTKIDLDGNIFGTKEYDLGCSEYGYSIYECTDSGFIIIGGGCSDLSIWLLKTDNNGDTLWTRNYGSAGLDMGNSVKQCLDKGFVITGSVMYGKMFLLKTDSLGNAPALDSNIELPENDSYKINIYPNPANDLVNLNFKFNKPEDIIIELYNITGKKVVFLYEDKNIVPDYNYNINIDTKGLCNGVYFVSLRTQNYSQTLKLNIVK